MHLCRAALEAIAFQITTLINAMIKTSGIELKELRVDGGPTRNSLLMQLQSDILQVPVICSDVEDASALGAFLINGFARKKWTSFDDAKVIWKYRKVFNPSSVISQLAITYEKWLKAMNQLIKTNT